VVAIFGNPQILNLRSTGDHIGLFHFSQYLPSTNLLMPLRRWARWKLVGEPTLLPLKQICQRLVESPEVGDIEIVVGNTEFLTTGEHGVVARGFRIARVPRAKFGYRFWPLRRPLAHGGRLLTRNTYGC